jgi:alpha-tubulin suppressor-like RCC1 family protein
VVVAGDATKDWDLSGWTDMAALAAGNYFLVGLREDGTVLKGGKLKDANTGRLYPVETEIYVDGWKDIICISAGHDHVVGISSDGRIWATGKNGEGECDCNGMYLFRN